MLRRAGHAFGVQAFPFGNALTLNPHSVSRDAGNSGQNPGYSQRVALHPSGSVVTLITVIGSLALGFCIGLPLAVLQVYGPSFIRRLIGVYVWFFRGMPILLLLFLFYFGLFEVIGLNLSTITASCLVLGMASAAYQSQIFRGSIETLPVGQFRAARASA